MTALLMIGTAKGLFLATRDRVGDAWKLSSPQFPMTSVYAVGIDPRPATPRLLAGVESSHFGPSVAISDDLGASWREPEEAPLAFPKETDTALTRVWAFAPSAAEPEVVWAGTQPAALFKSANGGVTYDLVSALWDHPHRPQWGAGFGGQAIHTVLPHPADPRRVLVALSTGGVYRTTDGGESWNAANTGIKAYFLPGNQYPEFGQCVHKVSRDGANPERLYLQNHHGVYRSDDDGQTWSSIAETLPSDFGFPIVAHPRRADVAWNFPLQADSHRFPIDHRCQVFQTTDGGQTWHSQSHGLPSAPFYPSVLRDAMCADDGDPAGVYFGARSGEVFASPDEGESWAMIASHLPSVLCVRAVVL